MELAVLELMGSIGMVEEFAGIAEELVEVSSGAGSNDVEEEAATFAFIATSATVSATLTALAASPSLSFTSSNLFC